MTRPLKRAFRPVCVSAVVILLVALGAPSCVILAQALSPLPRSLQIHRIAGGPDDVFANAYIVEGVSGSLVVDAQLTRAAGRRLRERIDASGKPLVAVILTHGHPDHYGGMASLVEGRTSIPIVAVQGVDRIVRRDDAMKGKLLASAGFDFPARRVFPNVVVGSGVRLTFGEFALTAIDIGEAESHHDSYWMLHAPDDDHAFVGDLVMNGVHAYTGDGHSGRRIEGLGRLKKGFSDRVRIYPGHGDTGGKELLGMQRRYLEEFRAQVRALAAGRSRLSEGDAHELQRRMTAFLGHHNMARWVLEGANPVAAELANERRRPTRR